MTSHARAIVLAGTALMALAPALGARQPEELIVDPAGTSITLHVGRAGLFGFAGHDHEIVAPVLRGRVDLDRADVTRSRVVLEFAAADLLVTGQGEPAEDVPEVQRVMLSERVLDVRRYPTIAFRSSEVALVQTSAETMVLRVVGDLTLHGVTRSLSLPMNVTLAADRLVANGRTSIRQTDFDIEPVTAGAGTVRVKDRIDVTFSVAARRR